MPEIKILVTDGRLDVSVSDDIAINLPLVLGLLDMAKSAWVDHSKQSERRVQPATQMPPVMHS